MQDQPPAFPESEPFEVPVNWNTSKRHQDRVVVAGRGPKPADIMFLASGTLEEEVVEEEHGMHGAIFRRKPAFLKGPHGVELKDMCMSVGISVDSEVYYTALCKWLLGRDRNLNPKAGDIQPGSACCRREIKEVAPKIIVAFGKAAFEFLVPIRFKFGDAIGMWFWSEEFQCRVMPMSSQYYVAAKPEWMERYRMDMAQVKKLSDELKGIAVERVPLHYRTVTCAAELRQLVKDIMPFTLYCPDCEWHGKNHAAGKLRSLQIGWQPGHAAYIRFMDDKLNYVFDVSYEEAGAILAPAWNRPEVKLVGHHISADLPWIAEWLKLEWYGKVRLDTEFAYQCCNEHGERGLERMSLRYTDLGRYEFELEMWKKDHKQEVEDGYGRVPDEILILYGCKDVDVPLRALPYIELDLQQQGMLEYYRTIMNPFVSDVFTQFAITGLPMNVPLMDEMRLLYSYAYSEMEAALRRSLYTEAWFLLARNAVEILPAFKAVDEPLRGIVSKQAVANFKLELQDVYERHGAEEMQIPSTKVIRDLCMAFLQLEEGSLTPDDLRCLDASCNHACSTHAFNLRSVTDMRRWLFDIKKYTPVKSTANKAKGVPSMDWAKVMSWKPSRREGIVPAVDKQTLQILSVAHDDPVLKELLELNAVGNIRKAFLKDPELDEDGNVVEEAGLHAWLAPDHRVHGQMSMTETARPRAWKPNSLNWPSYVQQRIVDGIARVLKIAHERGDLPQVFEKYLKDKPPALRHCVQAPPGMCFVESDFKTAEVRALAYRAGDENLIRIMNEPDQQFGLAPVKTKDGAIKYKPVRLKYDADCGILTQEQDSRFIMNVWSEGKFECKVAPEDLKRDRAGNLVHPPADLHWSLAEMFQEKPRELMTDKKDRGAGKAGNFKCLPEDTVVTTSHGAKTIKNVVAGLHKVWDGVEWVHHEGLITKGIQPIVEYQGLRATVDHGVWVEDGREMFFGEAILQGLNLARTTDETGEAAVAGFEARRRNNGERRQGAHASHVHMSVLRKKQVEVDRQPCAEQGVSVCVLQSNKSYTSYSEDKVQNYAAAVRNMDTQEFIQLHRTRNSRLIQGHRTLCYLGSPKMASRNVQGQGLRQDRQRWALRARKFTPSGSSHESGEHTNVYSLIWSKDASICRCAPRGATKVSHNTKSAVRWMRRGVYSQQLEVWETPMFRRHKSKLANNAGAASEGRQSEDRLCVESRAQSDSGRSDRWADSSPMGHSKRSTTCKGDVSKDCVFPRTTPGCEVWGSGGSQTAFARRILSGYSHRLGYIKSESIPLHDVGACAVIHADASWVESKHESYEASSRFGIDRGSNTEEVPYHGRPKEILIAELSARGFKLTLEHVYDLVNAGPRRRFTANGVLVSNTAYGSTPGTLERSIEADTGFKPEPGTGQKILDALQRRQPTAVAFLDDLETKVEDPGYLRAASGKVRHFLLPSNVHGLSPRLKNAIISAQKRESRNFYMQESVAATALRATYWLLQFKRKYGLVGVPITVLYDSVVTMCPFEERAIWAKAHELFMFRANGWEYHGRVLTYPIDTDFNAGWSMPYKATIDQKHIGPLLENENFCPTPERLRPVETWLDDSIAFYTANTRASLEPKHFV